MRGYAGQCESGISAVFSLTENGFRAVTVEVNPKTMDIVQAKGKRNRLAGPFEMGILGKWIRFVREKASKECP